MLSRDSGSEDTKDLRDGKRRRGEDRTRSILRRGFAVEDKPLGRVSRRLQGLPPEFSPMRDEVRSGGSGVFYGRARSDAETGKHALLHESPESGRVKGITPLKDEEGSRPVATFGTPSPGKVYPRSVETPGGTKLERVLDFGACAFYEEAAKFAPSVPAIADDFEAKTFSITLTPEMLREVKQECARNNGRRTRSQHSVMGGSAGGEVERMGVKSADDEKWEWLHLVAHRLIGGRGQVPENLVAGTYHANTAMLLVAEQHIEKMVRENRPVILEVSAYLKEGSQVASRIDYSIKVEGARDINFTFDARTQVKPPLVVGKYTEELLRRRGAFDDFTLPDRGDRSQPPPRRR